MNRILLNILIIISIPSLCFSQYYFGQNKVQYTDFNWQVLTTEHFNIYFYPQEEQIAQVGAKLAEESYQHHVEKFNLIIDKKIPLIIYSSPIYFSQTNVIPQLLPEGVAGFTEYFKERVVVHYHGSYEDYKHLIQHELTHVFQMEKIMYVARSHRKRNPPPAPLWFTEGLAEYWSEGWSSDGDMIIRDMVVSGNMVTLDRIVGYYGTFLMYKVGQSVIKFMSETYGDDKLTLLFENWWKETTFEGIVEITYGKTLNEIWREWEYHLKKTYYPYMKDQHLPGYVAKQLTRKRYNVKPTVFSNIAEDGEAQDLVAFKTYRLGYSNIALMPLNGENQGLKRLVKGQRSAKFESLHFIDSKIDVNDNGRLTFASKSHESDVLYIYDTRRKEVVDQYRFPGLINISSPAWSPEGGRIAFSGTTEDGQTDIYLYAILSDTLSKLTSDVFYDQTPTFSRNGEMIVFSSDRSGYKGINLFALTLESGEVKQLTFGDHKNLSPRWSSKSDRFLFTSDRGGVSNVFMIEEPLGPESQLIQVTDFVTGAFDPAFTSDDSALVFCGYQDQSYHIYSLNFDSVSAKQPLAEAKSWREDQGWKPGILSGDYIKGNVKYKTKFSFDIAQSIIAYDAVSGSIGGLQGAFTDMLGNHQTYFLLYNTADSKSEIIDNFNVAVTYLNRKRRLNWGAGLYRFYNEYTNDIDGFVTEETYGGLLTTSYPFSRFDRLEASVYMRKYYKETLRGDDPDAVIGTAMLSYIKDTSIWGPAGPIDGFRMHLTLAGTANLKQASYFNSSVNVDVRKYFRLSESSAYAIRAMYFTSDGTDPQRYYLGGSWDLRGYPHRSYYGNNLVLINNELRFPLINRLYIGFPFGAMNLQAIRGALFFDAGKAWEDEMGNLAGSFGFGIRVSLGYITVLRFDFSRKTDFKHVENGFDFDFFFGWNF